MTSRKKAKTTGVPCFKVSLFSWATAALKHLLSFCYTQYLSNSAVTLAAYQIGSDAVKRPIQKISLKVLGKGLQDLHASVRVCK